MMTTTTFKVTRFKSAGTHYMLRILGITVWESLLSSHNKSGWFRLFGGVGIAWSKELRFSQRIGKKKFFKFLNWNLEYIK